MSLLNPCILIYHIIIVWCACVNLFCHCFKIYTKGKGNCLKIIEFQCVIVFLCLSPLPRLGAYKLISGLHTQARLLGARIKTDNQGWSKMAKGKGPKPI